MVAAIWRALERRGAPIAAIAAIGTAIVGLIWGTYVAGGPDSYCHINQAELFVQGRVHDPQPIVEDAPWPDRVNTAVPVGHVAAPRGAIAAVPMCPPGYAASLAFARLIGGRAAMFWVVPLFGALGVWCTFLIGRRLAGAAGRPAGRDPPCDQSSVPLSARAANVGRAGRWNVGGSAGPGARRVEHAPSVAHWSAQRRRVVHAPEPRAAWVGDGRDRGHARHRGSAPERYRGSQPEPRYGRPRYGRRRT